MAKQGAEKAQIDAEKAKTRFMEDTLMAEKASELAKQRAKEAKVQTLRDENDAAKAECIAQQARHQLSKLRLEAEKAKSLLSEELDNIEESKKCIQPNPGNKTYYEALLMYSIFKIYFMVPGLLETTKNGIT